MYLLIIEDDPMVAMIHQEYCKKIGLALAVKQVSSLAQARQALSRQRPDLILMDNYLPDGQGVDFLPEVFGIPVIMITAANDSETVKKSVAQGVLDYLVKPFTYERFELAMAKANNYRLLLSKERLSQVALDNYFFAEKTSSASLDLPKGLTKITLSKIVANIDAQPGTFTTQTIADSMAISRITIKKYLNYLVSLGYLVEDADYLTSGRPVSVYHIGDRSQIDAYLDR